MGLLEAKKAFTVNGCHVARLLRDVSAIQAREDTREKTTCMSLFLHRADNYLEPIIIFSPVSSAVA